MEAIPREKTFQGVIAASITPFCEDRSVDGEAMRALMRYYAQGGLCGAFVCSSSGEYYAMTDAQRAIAVAAAASAGTQLTLLAQISADRPDEAITRAIRMADAGADAVVCQPPRFLDYAPDELYAFFWQIADGSPVPLVLYNHLTRLNNKLMPPLLMRLAKHENILALKDTHNDASRMASIAALLPEIIVYAGGDAMAGEAALHEAYLLNALAGVAPTLMCALLEAGRRGDRETVDRLQARVDALSKIYGMLGAETDSITAFAGALRAALYHKGLIGSMQCAQFGVPISRERIDAIASYAENCCQGWEA